MTTHYPHADWLAVLAEPAAVVSVDGVIRAANDRFAALLGDGPAVGRPLSDLLVAPEDHPPLAERLRAWSRRKQAAPASLRLRTAEGQRPQVVEAGRLSAIDDDREPAILLRLRSRARTASNFRIVSDRVDALAREVVARKQAEAEAHAQREQFRVIFDQAAVGIAQVDPTGHFRMVNDRFCEITGYAAAQLRQRTVDQLTHPDDRGRTVAAMRELIDGRTDSFTLEKRYVRKDGGTTWVRVNASLISEGEGRSSVFLGMVEDINERKQAEASLRRLTETLEQRVAQRTAQLRSLAAELTQAEQRERRRLAQLLHDHLQQLLVAAKLQVSMARGRAADDEQRGILVEVNDLLDQSVSASRSLTMELSPPILYEGGLRAGLEWLARWMQEKHRLEVQVGGDEDVEPPAEDARVFLFNAVRELLFNIVKHAGTDRATIQLERTADDQLQIDVQDRGRGYDPDTVRAARDDRGGLGLFSIDERLNVLGGEMSVVSKPGEGTRTTLRLPLNSRPQPAPSPVEDAETNADATRRAAVGRRPRLDTDAGPTRVLVVDDHAIVREGLVRLINSHPAVTVVGEASDGEQAVQRAQQLYPDVVVMDVTMPRLSGVEATRQIVAALPDVRVIALSVHDARDMAANMQAAGAESYLSKDGPSEHLIAAIRGERPVAVRCPA